MSLRAIRRPPTRALQLLGGKLGILRHHCKWVMPVQIGSTLKIDLAQASTNIDVFTGENLEQIHIEGISSDKQVLDARNYLNVNSTPDTVSVKGTNNGTFKCLRLMIPEKWCSLHVLSGSADVQVQNINEADINVELSGGNILLGKVKGREAHVNSGGGSIIADLVSAVCRIHSLGGTVSVKKMVGTIIGIDTGGGGLHIGWLYGEDVTLQTLRGELVLEHIRATKNAKVGTEGGKVVIKGLEGKATINSNGGDVEVQLYDGAEEVTIDSGEGSVVVYLSSQLVAEVEHVGTGDLDMQHSDVNVEYQETCRRSETQSLRVCRMKVSSCGPVKVRRRSWLESRVGISR